MPIQVYECPEHGQFEVETEVGAPASEPRRCKAVCGGEQARPDDTGQTLWYCDRPSPWVPQVVAIRVKGGTTPNR